MMRRTTERLMLLAVILTVMACSVHKNTPKSRFWQSFTAKYNSYYNGKQAFIDGMLEKEKGNKDDYTEMLPLFAVGNKQSLQLGSGNFDLAVEKMEKSIKQHSIKAKPEWNKSRRKTQKDIEWLQRREYNPFLWKAWLMLGQSQFQKGAFDEAAATFSYMSRLYQTQPAINGQARAWLALCYTHLDWMYDAEDVIRNMSRDSIPYSAQPAWDRTMADYYLRNGELDKAVTSLRKVIRREHRKTLKARQWFIMGQAQTALGHYNEAYKAYSRVVRQNPPYDLEFNARIAQTEVMATSPVGGAKTARKMISRLKHMAASDNNKDFLDQVYYAIGNIYMAQKDTAQAIAAYEKGNEKATRSGTEKGVLLLRLGDIYWTMERYNDAQRCYGEAIGMLDKERPGYDELSNRSKVLDELVPYTDAVHLQDSLQQLALMPEKERLEAIDRVIDALKKKEKEEADKARAAEVEQAQQQQGAQGNRNQPQKPQPTTSAAKDGQWYFYNQMAVNQGKQAFQKQWGKRENADNWQRMNKTVVGDLSAMPTDSDTPETLQDGMQQTDSLSAAKAEDSEVADSLANDPHNREYYLAQIPFTEEEKEASNLIIKDGLYNSGVIFKDKLDNLPLAEKQLVRLSSHYPDFEQMDQAWYHLFLLYSRQGRTALADSCLVYMKEGFPDSDWTILLSDPYFAENARFGMHIEDSIYAATYDAFKAGRHDMIVANDTLTAKRFPLGANRAKFIFLHGISLLNQDDAKGCVERLKTVVEKYPQSEVSEMAGMIIKGVQEGRQLYGGKFDLDDIWSRRDLSAATDSLASDTLSAERDVPFVFMVVYQPDSVNENQLLYEMARFNFSNYLVRNFDLNIERMQGINRMVISGFLNFDEALQYARQITAANELNDALQKCRCLVISRQNLAMIGTRFSYRDYDEFYEQTFMPLQISNEELLQIPDYVEPTEEDEEEGQTEEAAPQTPTGNNGYLDFDEDFY